ncbi:MAG TPA: M48 family metalloprotease, partial [Nannocystis sp.]
HEAVMQVFGAYDDRALQAYVQEVGERVARASHQPELSWHFTLLDDPTVNAFALPGGYIYITRGILVHLNSEAQLAGVLGHEIAHVTARHGAGRITQEQLAGLGLGLASIVSPIVQRWGGVVQLALGLLFLRYGRDDETEADALAITYAAGAGYDPRQIPATYEMLARVQPRDAERLPTFLSTHPDPGDREARTRELAQKAVQRQGNAQFVVRADTHNRRMDGVVFGPDPREGYFDDNHYYHPGLRFQIRLPEGWYGQNTRVAVLAAAPDDSGAMQLSVADADGLSPAAFVARLAARGDIVDADGDTETIGGFPAWVGRIAAAVEGEAPVPLTAAFIRKADQMFQILGQTRGDDAIVLASIRSFADLTDPARLAVRPARVHVARAPATGRFASVVTSLGVPPHWVEESAILNNVRAGQAVDAGALLKFIAPAGPSAAPRRGEQPAAGSR